MRKTQILKIQKNQYQKEKLFSCTQCTSKFANPNYLKIHKNQHPNEKPFSCTQCASKLVNPKIRTKMKNHSAANIACQVCSNL